MCAYYSIKITLIIIFRIKNEKGLKRGYFMAKLFDLVIMLAMIVLIGSSVFYLLKKFLKKETKIEVLVIKLSGIVYLLILSLSISKNLINFVFNIAMLIFVGGVIYGLIKLIKKELNLKLLVKVIGASLAVLIGDTIIEGNVPEAPVAFYEHEIAETNEAAKVDEKVAEPVEVAEEEEIIVEEQEEKQEEFVEKVDEKPGIVDIPKEEPKISEPKPEPKKDDKTTQAPKPVESTTPKEGNTNPSQPKPNPLPVKQDDEKIFVYKTATGSKYHLAGCRHLSRSKIEINLKEAKLENLHPCSVCHPPK